MKASLYQVRIVDAETGVPIPGAVVELHEFPSSPESPDADHPRGAANARGEVTIRDGRKPTIWQVRAKGYVEQRVTRRPMARHQMARHLMARKEGALPPRYAAHAGGGYDGVIHLYQMPEPQLGILVSDAYSGPLAINLVPAPGFGYVRIDEIHVAFAAVDPQASYIQGAAGRRNFTATASPGGVVDLVVAPLLYDLQTSQLQVRDGGGVLPYRDIARHQNGGHRNSRHSYGGQDTGRGVWGDVNQDDKTVHHQIRLFVGTLKEYLAFLGSMQ